MKKLIIGVFCLVALTFASLETQAQHDGDFGITPQGGYSWQNGVAGVELQYLNLAISGGWLPTSVPLTGTPVNSYSGAITWYGNAFDNGGYVSFAVASAGYRYGSSFGDEEILPMSIIGLGYRYWMGPISLKFGAGYGWCDKMDAFTFEVLLSYTF